MSVSEPLSEDIKQRLIFANEPNSHADIGIKNKWRNILWSDEDSAATLKFGRE